MERGHRRPRANHTNASNADFAHAYQLKAASSHAATWKAEQKLSEARRARANALTDLRASCGAIRDAAELWG